VEPSTALIGCYAASRNGTLPPTFQYVPKATRCQPPNPPALGESPPSPHPADSQGLQPVTSFSVMPTTTKGLPCSPAAHYTARLCACSTLGFVCPGSLADREATASSVVPLMISRDPPTPL
jgi:hypothetical protein